MYEFNEITVLEDNINVFQCPGHETVFNVQKNVQCLHLSSNQQVFALSIYTLIIFFSEYTIKLLKEKLKVYLPRYETCHRC